MTNVKQAILFADSARGQYIPQHFAESAQRDQFTGIDSEQWAILESGPDNESYLDVWCEVLDSAETIDGGVLHQDGDLWIIWPQLAIDAINAECESYREYEESDIDAGNNYAHMVAESWWEESTRRLVKQLRESSDVNPAWESIDIERLADIAIQCFRMESGHIFSIPRAIVLDSYHVQEIEIELSHLGIDDLTMDYVRESCDAYITGTDRAYVTSDAVWYAVLDIDQFNEAIAND